MDKKTIFVMAVMGMFAFVTVATAATYKTDISLSDGASAAIDASAGKAKVPTEVMIGNIASELIEIQYNNTVANDFRNAYNKVATTGNNDIIIKATECMNDAVPKPKEGEI